MSVSALGNRSLAAIGGVGALAAGVGGGVYFKVTGTAAVLGGIFAVAGVIALLAAVVFAAYRHYSTPTPVPTPVWVLDGDFLPPLAQKPIVSRKVSNCIAGVHEASSVSLVFNIPALVQATASFLSAEDTVSAERTCVAWSRWVPGTLAWKPKCDQEGIPPIKRKGKDPKTGEDTILYFYKEAYVRLWPMIFGPKQYFDCLGVKPAGEIRRLKDSIHADIYRLDPSYIEPLPLQRNAQRKYRLFYLSREIEQPTLNEGPAREPMTINRLGELAPQARNPTKYGYISSFLRDQRGNEPLDRSDWVLMSAEVIPGTQNASYPNQVNTVSALGARPPKAIEVIALNFFNYFRFGTRLFGQNPLTYSRIEVIALNFFNYFRFGTRLFGQNPLTYSRAETTVTVHNLQYHIVDGGFSPSGLYVFYDPFDLSYAGLAAAFSCGSS